MKLCSSDNHYTTAPQTNIPRPHVCNCFVGQNGKTHGQTLYPLYLKIMTWNKNGLRLVQKLTAKKNNRLKLEEKYAYFLTICSIKIIFSYLSNRQQYVQLNDKKSSYRPIYFGVSQGSIPGLVLFNIHLSSLPSCLKFNSIQYADDTSLYLSDSIRNIQSTISILETEFNFLIHDPKTNA